MLLFLVESMEEGARVIHQRTILRRVVEPAVRRILT